MDHRASLTVDPNLHTRGGRQAAFSLPLQPYLARSMPLTHQLSLNQPWLSPPAPTSEPKSLPRSSQTHLVKLPISIPICAPVVCRERCYF